MNPAACPPLRPYLKCCCAPFKLLFIFKKCLGPQVYLGGVLRDVHANARQRLNLPALEFGPLVEWPLAPAPASASGGASGGASLGGFESAAWHALESEWRKAEAQAEERERRYEERMRVEVSLARISRFRVGHLQGVLVLLGCPFPRPLDSSGSKTAFRTNRVG